jgi:predicted DCC family thiol-disulfide oxidoreductase YuxK
MADKPARVTVWFDSQCPLCTKEIGLMRRLDWHGRVNFIDIYAATDCPLDPAQLLERLHAQEVGQPLVDGAAAFAVLWRHLPLLKPLGVLARLPFVLSILERAYVAFLRIRPRLQKLVSNAQ